jgi:transposase InsO family protein
MKKTTSERIITQLEAMFARHGIPRTIKSDNGPQFVSEEFKDYLQNNGIYSVLASRKWRG